MTPILASDTTGAFVWLILLIFRAATVATALPAIISLAIYFKTRDKDRRRKRGLWLAIISGALGGIGLLFLLLVPSEPVPVELALMLVPLVTAFTAFFLWMRTLPRQTL